MGIPTELRARLERHGVLSIGLATGVVAVLGWLLLAVVARLLGPSGYAAFAVLWGVFFALAGVFSGLRQEVTRSVTAEMSPMQGASHVTGAQSRGRPIVGSLVLASCVAAAIVLSAPWWSPAAFGRHWATGVGAMVAGAFGLAVHSTVMGALAARKSWRPYAAALSGEPILRLLIVLITVGMSHELANLMWGVVSGSFVWVLLMLTRDGRLGLVTPGDVPTARFARQSVHAMAAAGCSALLVAGFPFLVRVTSSQPLDDSAGVLFAAIMATRAPVLLPLTGFQLPILTHLVARNGSLAGALTPIAATLAATGVGLIVCCYFFGPTLLQLVFGPEFVTSGRLLALLAFAGIELAALTLTGLAALAANRHVSYMVGWSVATIVTMALLTLPMPVTPRSVLAICTGPVIGILIHLLGMGSVGDRSAKIEDPSRHMDVERLDD